MSERETDRDRQTNTETDRQSETEKKVESARTGWHGD